MKINFRQYLIFEFCATLSSQVKNYELLCFKHRGKFGFGNGVEFYCVFIQETWSNSQYWLLFATYKIPLLFQHIQKLVKKEVFLINELIREYLEFQGYKHSLSVFLPGRQIGFGRCHENDASFSLMLIVGAASTQRQANPWIDATSHY